LAPTLGLEKENYMKKSILFVFSLLLSVSASAATPSFAVLHHHSDFDKLHKCICKGWQDAKPSDAQKSDSEAFIKIANDSWNEHKDGIKSSKKDLMDAWAAYPINESDVTSAEKALHEHICPVHIAMRSSTISILNLLSADQRKDFDKSFNTCYETDIEFALN
jgi:hypothetical protein